MLNKKFIDRIFWNSYATAYDDIAKYYKPYKVLMNFIISFILKKSKNGRILDAGCGTGELSAKLAENGFELDSLDISKVMLDMFKRKIIKRNLKNIRIKQGDLNKKLLYVSNRFDFVINVHSLFMLDDKRAVLTELGRVLKKNGFLIIAHHKPIKLQNVIAAVLREEGLIGGLGVLAKLFKVGFYNIFLGQLHRKVYGDISVKSLVDYMKEKKFKYIISKILYNGFDELVILQKTK